MSLKGLLIGEEHLFAALSSIVIFLSFSFKIALVIWIITYLIMCFLFRNNHGVIRYINDLKKNILHVSSTRISLWVKDFWALRKEVLNKIDRDAHTNPSKFKFNLSPFSVFQTGMIGVFMALLTYENLVDNSGSFTSILLENYAVLLCVLSVLNVIFYLGTVKNIFHMLYGNKTLFRILFFIFSVIMFVAATMISMNR